MKLCIRVNKNGHRGSFIVYKYHKPTDDLYSLNCLYADEVYIEGPSKTGAMEKAKYEAAGAGSGTHIYFIETEAEVLIRRPGETKLTPVTEELLDERPDYTYSQRLYRTVC